MPAPNVQAKFIEPMLLRRTESLPEGDGWIYATDASATWSTRPLALLNNRLGSRVLIHKYKEPAYGPTQTTQHVILE